MNEHRIIASTVEERTEMIGRFPLFSALDHHERARAAANAVVLRFADGEPVVREGEYGLGFYVLAEGAARVVQDGETVARLGVGEFFGEASLLELAPRNASVLADGGCTCVGFLRHFFKEILMEYPRIAMAVLEEEALRLPPREDG